MLRSFQNFGLDIPLTCPAQLVWPRPSRIPWEHVSPQWTSTAIPPIWTSSEDTNRQWAEWASSFESSLNGFVQHQPGQVLQPAQKGRLQKTKPQKRPMTASVLKPSRPSEVQLRNDLIGSAVKQWFRQLRRLQSYQAAIMANKTTNVAVVYRLELWMAIKRSPGFLDGFVTWWTSHRSIALPDTPPSLPLGPPDASTAQAIFQTFKINFEHYEQWHLRQRGQLLQTKYDKGMRGIFQDLKTSQREQLDLLTQERSFAVLAVDPQEHQLHLDAPILTEGFARWTHEGTLLTAQPVNDVVLQLDDTAQFSHGDVLF